LSSPDARPSPAPPASGAWRPGDPPGRRQFAAVGPLWLERGGRLDVDIAYETWGRLNAARDNAVLVLHALTADSHVHGPAEPGHPTPGWWHDLVGPGAALDPAHHFIVAPNVLGGCQGTTGPSSLAADGRPYGSRFPYLTVRDQVAAEARLADHLGVARWALVLGGSMGGMRAVEWAVTYPDRVARVAAIATSAQATADQIAFAHPQVAAIRADPHFWGGDYYSAPPGWGPHTGLGLARQIAHATYRSPGELQSRFGTAAQAGEEPLGGGGRFAVQSYLDHHGAKLANRFDANSDLVLTEAMLSHDVGRGRGGVAAALARVEADALVLGIDSDRLFPVQLSRALARRLPRAVTGLIRSRHGHDGFLLEWPQVARALRSFLPAVTA
jgi:homoserine O-acetyltransferase